MKDKYGSSGWPVTFKWIFIRQKLLMHLTYLSSFNTGIYEGKMVPCTRSTNLRRGANSGIYATYYPYCITQVTWVQKAWTVFLGQNCQTVHLLQPSSEALFEQSHQDTFQRLSSHISAENVIDDWIDFIV